MYDPNSPILDFYPLEVELGLNREKKLGGDCEDSVY